MKLTPLSKGIILILGVILLYFGLKIFAPGLLSKVAPQAQMQESSVPPKADLPSVAGSSAGQIPAPDTKMASMPMAEPGCTQLPEVRFYLWAWNSQLGAMYANGGAQAVTGSMMCEKGVNLKFVREDDPARMQEALIAFATELSQGKKHPTKGAHYVAIMGDGAASFLKGLNDTLTKIGPQYRAKVVGSAGYSRGEDKFMGPPAWKATPLASRGGLVSGYLRDGDWNIALKWLGDNELCNNPDEKTYDPQCLNWVAANDYIDAAEKYIAGYCEERPVVTGGKRTGETKKVCVDGVVTWTPGDVTIAQKRGGLVSIVSTKEYSSQMPNTIIGIDKWMKSNPALVEGMLDAIFSGGDRVRSNPEAFHQAAAISAAVYNEEDAAYWAKYFKVVVEKDKQGLDVELGGSAVNSLADNLQLFGLVPGSANLFGATYSVFGDVVKSQYPDLLPSYYPVKDILDTSYVASLSQKAAPKTEAQMPKFSPEEKVQSVVSRRAWHINFDSGRATFTPSAEREMEPLLKDLLVAGNTLVEVHGHTDSQGSPDQNRSLSEDRAFAVKQWLEKRSPVNFPNGRVRIFAHGQDNPVAPNSTTEGRAQNRRVEIVIGTSS